MERTPLERMLAQGMSLEAIGRELDLHPSTVAYWIRRHGLAAAHSGRFSPRGAPSRPVIESLAASGATLREMAAATDRSISTIRHWLARWEIERPPARGARTPADPRTAPREVLMRCARHGETTFRLESRGSYRCCRCRQDRVAERRRAIKRVLVAEAGGQCARCGYDACIAALHFHHLDPATKDFALSNDGVTRSIERAVRELPRRGRGGHGVDPSPLSSPGWIRTTKN
jgi:transposase